MISSLRSESITWAAGADSIYPDTVWGELGRVVTQWSKSRLYGDLAMNVLTWAGPAAIVGAGAVFASAAAAYVVSLRSG